MAISRRLIEQGHNLVLLNRGSRNNLLPEAEYITADINDEPIASHLLAGYSFDCVVDFIAYSRKDLERDYRLFKGKTKQYIFISSASAYQKPPVNNIITEDTPLINPFWEYSRGKIECEDFLIDKFRNEDFPITIVRPSHTYDERKIPLTPHGKNGGWQIVNRMIEGKPVIIHGDGTSLWTLTHNSDFAVGFTGLIGNPHALGQAVQIMTEESLTWNQIFQIVAQTIDVKLNVIHISSEFLSVTDDINLNLQGELLGDKAYSVNFDTTKLKRLVPEFTQKVSMKEGIQRSVLNILHHPELQVLDPDFDKWCDRVIVARNEAFKFFKANSQNI